MNLDQFEQVLNLAKEKEEQALVQLRNARIYLQQNEQQMSSLTFYKDDYIKQFSKKQQGLVSGQMHQQYHDFLMNIDRSMERQRMALKEIQEHVEHCHRQWQVLNQKYRAIEKLIEREKKALILREELNEQNELDEFVNAQYLRKKRNES